MVSISNGGPNEVSNKRPLENGCIPKYKPRRVSAVRDFPPLCGPNPVPLNLKPEEVRVSEAGPVLDGAFGSPQMAEIIGPQVVANLEANIKTEINEVSAAEMHKFVKDCGVKEGTPIKNDVGCSGVTNSNNEVVCESHEVFNVALDIDMTESLDGLVGKIMESANLDENLSARLPEFHLPNEVEYHGLEAVNNPIEVERTESMDMFVGNVTTTTTKEKEGSTNAAENLFTYFSPNDVNTLDGLEIDSRNKETEARGQTMLDEYKLENLISVNKSGVEEVNSRSDASVRVKDKYCRRSVSAVRDFPPHCGRNVPSPTEEGCKVASQEILPETVLRDGTIKQLTPTSEAKCLNGLQNTRVEKESTALNNAGAGERPSGSGKSNMTLQQNIIQKIERGDVGDHNEDVPEIANPISAERAGKNVVYSPGTMDEIVKPSYSTSSSDSEDDENRNIVYALMAEPNDPWKKAKTFSVNNQDRKASEVKNKKLSPPWWHKSKAVAKKSIQNVKSSIPPSKKLKKVRISNDDDDNIRSPGISPPAVSVGQKRNFPTKPSKQQDFEVILPPFGPSSSSHGDARNKVRDTLRAFNAVCRKLLQQEEANSTAEAEGKPGRNVRRIDLYAAKVIKERGKEVNTGKPILGDVSGVLVGDEFQYRVELAIVGIHRLYQAGIDSMKLDNGLLVATSIVSSGSYSDDLENADVLVYSGQGGNVIGKQKQQPQDQKLERGNLALKNSIDAKTPVRVIRGWRDKAVDPLDPKPKLVTTYVYDGLYTVERYWTETGPHGKNVFMFELCRNPGQPELAWKQLKKSNKARYRPGVCIMDISGGKEPFGIPAVNTLNDEKPPQFNYIPRMMYPEWHKPVAPPGCDCAGRCLDSRKCRCAVRNGGEIPYNRNGALVETKLLVYECGPHCKCPPSCYNRVTQRGIRHQLEIFRTEARGWGVRALTSIPSGSFICEYAGELLEDTEAERRIGSDEYLFDIGENLSGSSLNPKDQALSAELVEDGGYTIDACQYGNIGRFINHSCAPNLYAQNVIYDHDDMKMPHIMLFAMENIPPLQELTYHYNYSVDQIRDSQGNIKVKKCYCGAAECTGRMY